MTPFRQVILLCPFLFLTFSACSQDGKEPDQNKTKTMTYSVEKSEEEWKKELTEKEFEVLREKGTERAFTGEYYDYKGDGIFHCAGCGNPVFDSDTKYASGSGWPSFYAPLKEGNVELKKDTSMGMTRIEVVCANCGGHLGHVFEDGPEPTGKRYCINSVSLDLEEK